MATICNLLLTSILVVFGNSRGQYSFVTPEQNPECLGKLNIGGDELQTQLGETISISGTDIAIGSSIYKCLRVLNDHYLILEHVLRDDQPSDQKKIKCWTIRKIIDGAYLVTEFGEGMMTKDELLSVNSSFCSGQQSATSHWNFISSADFSSGVDCIPQLRSSTFSIEIQEATETNVENDIWRCQGSWLHNCKRLRSLDYRFNSCVTAEHFFGGSGTLSCVGHFEVNGASHQLLYSKNTSDFYCMVLRGNSGSLISSLKKGLCDDRQSEESRVLELPGSVQTKMKVEQNCVSGAVTLLTAYFLPLGIFIALQL